jgi:hypothetical protein
MPDTPSILDIAGQLLSTAQALLGRMRPALSAPDRPRCALFLTIVEQYESALHLARIGLITHSALHVRSMLEALVTMTLLGQDGGFVDQMNYERLRGEKKVYENVLTNTTGLLPEQRADLEARLAACKAAFDPLHAKGLRPHVISKDFSKAGFGDMAAPYAMLCTFTHNDLAALAYRHQGDQGMTYRAAVEPEVVLTILSMAMFALVAAAKPLERLAKFPDGHFGQHIREMDRLLGVFLTTNAQSA